MQFSLAFVAAFVAATNGLAIPKQQVKRGSDISITPHDSYSSSVGVLGCHINTNRVAYFPTSVTYDNMCVKVSANGRSVHLLKVDQSGGAYDMSYDAWNYLNVGQSATVNPTAGGGIPATYEDVDMSECADLVHTPDGKIPLSAANSMGFYSANPTDKLALYNIANPCCTLGFDEVCHLPSTPGANQADCPHTLGLQDKLTVANPVMNIAYPSGKLVAATQ